MKLRNIIKSAAEILGLQDVSGLAETSFDKAQENSTFKILQRCANLVLANITSNYIDCETSQTFTVKNGLIEYGQFSNTFLKVKSVKSNGVEVNHSLFIGFIKVPNGRVEVEYSYVPSFSNFDDEVTLNGLSEQGFVYGVLAEFAFISGMFNEAKIWNEKFEQFLFSTRSGYKPITIPARKW